MNIVIVEDSVIIQIQLITMLTAIKGLHIAGYAVAEDDAVKLIMSVKPDVVLMDISLEKGTGLNTLRRIRGAGSAAHVVMLTNHSEARFRQLSVELGAQAYFDKTKELEKLTVYLEKWIAIRNAANEACLKHAVLLEA